MSSESAGKFLTADVLPLLDKAHDFLAGQENYSHEALHGATKAFLDSEGLKLKALAQPLRIALTYRKDSPGLFEVMEVLGKERTLQRIQRARDWIEAKS